MKPGQRKVLFTCFKRNDKREVKVAQLAGSVAEMSSYHHGEVNPQSLTLLEYLNAEIIESYSLNISCVSINCYIHDREWFVKYFKTKIWLPFWLIVQFLEITFLLGILVCKVIHKFLSKI